MKLQDFLDYEFKIVKQNPALVCAKVEKDDPVYDALMIECAKTHKWIDTDDIWKFIDENNLPIEHFDTIETLNEKSRSARVKYYNCGTHWIGSTLTGIDLYKDRRGTNYLLDYKSLRLELDICDGEEEINRIGEFHYYRGSGCNFREYTGCLSVKELINSIVTNRKKEKRETMTDYNKKIRDLKQEYKHILGRMNNDLKILEELEND